MAIHSIANYYYSLFRHDRNNALINAMIDILWKVKSGGSVVLAL